MERAGISYGFFYLAGICGAGKCEAGALASARVFNQLPPFLVGVNMLTVCPDSALHQEIRSCAWQEAGQLEKYAELRAIVAKLAISTRFAAFGASNAIPLSGALPADREKLLSTLDEILAQASEGSLARCRRGVRHLRAGR